MNCENLCSFVPSLSLSIRGRRAVLYMRKTFSNVCHCEPWTSQLPNSHAGRWQPKRLRGASIYIVIYNVLAWANCVVYPVVNGQCEGLRFQGRQRNRHLRLFCVLSENNYYLLKRKCWIKGCGGGEMRYYETIITPVLCQHDATYWIGTNQTCSVNYYLWVWRVL